MSVGSQRRGARSRRAVEGHPLEGVLDQTAQRRLLVALDRRARAERTLQREQELGQERRRDACHGADILGSEVAARRRSGCGPGIGLTARSHRDEAGGERARRQAVEQGEETDQSADRSLGEAAERLRSIRFTSVSRPRGLWIA